MRNLVTFFGLRHPIVFIKLILVVTFRMTQEQEYYAFIYLLRHVSANYYGWRLVVSKLHKRKYTEVEASRLRKMKINFYILSTIQNSGIVQIQS